MKFLKIFIGILLLIVSAEIAYLFFAPNKKPTSQGTSQKLKIIETKTDSTSSSISKIPSSNPVQQKIQAEIDNTLQGEVPQYVALNRDTLRNFSLIRKGGLQSAKMNLVYKGVITKIEADPGRVLDYDYIYAFSLRSSPTDRAENENTFLFEDSHYKKTTVTDTENTNKSLTIPDLREGDEIIYTMTVDSTEYFPRAVVESKIERIKAKQP